MGNFSRHRCPSNKQYGKTKVNSWITVGDFAVKDALRLLRKAGVTLPPPALTGTALATTLISGGLEGDGTFNIEIGLDKALSYQIHQQVMVDIDNKFGSAADANYHRISNQAGMTSPAPWACRA